MVFLSESEIFEDSQKKVSISKFEILLLSRKKQDEKIISNQSESNL